MHQSWTGLSGICLSNNKNDSVQLGLLWPLCTVPGLDILHFLITQFSQKGAKKVGGSKERNQNEGVK